MDRSRSPSLRGLQRKAEVRGQDPNKGVRIGEASHPGPMHFSKDILATIGLDNISNLLGWKIIGWMGLGHLFRYGLYRVDKTSSHLFLQEFGTTPD